MVRQALDSFRPSTIAGIFFVIGTMGALNLYGFLAVVPAGLRPFFDAQVIFRYYLWLSLVLAFSSFFARQIAQIIYPVGRSLYLSNKERPSAPKKYAAFVMLGFLPPAVGPLVAALTVGFLLFLYLFVDVRGLLEITGSFAASLALSLAMIITSEMIAARNENAKLHIKVSKAFRSAISKIVDRLKIPRLWIAILTLMILLLSWQIGTKRAGAVLNPPPHDIVRLGDNYGIVFTVTSSGMIVLEDIVRNEYDRIETATFAFRSFEGETLVTKKAVFRK